MDKETWPAAPMRDTHLTEPPGLHSGAFVNTEWSVVLRAGGTSSSESAAALERLCRQYWRPLYCFVRRRGVGEHDAQDLTQGFFARLLEKGLVGAADRQRGRFRTFLLTALDHYINNEWKKHTRQKRGGDYEFCSLEQAAGLEAGYQEASMDSPDQIYERQWAHAILEAVLKRVRAEFDGRGGGSRFDVLKQFLFGDRGEVSYATAADLLGLSESAMRSAIHRMRQRYGELFSEEIARTTERPEDIDDEIRHLLSVLERRAGA